ncbi:MAG: T9SS type A sorting domain-containing protein, partial [Flavobacteriales bacterium]
SPNQRVSLVGIDEADAAFHIEAYPNPFSDHLQITILSQKRCNGTLTLRDALGRSIFSKSMSLFPGATDWSFYWSDLAPGAYFLQIDAERQRCIKLIKR